ncbi:site-specific integrase [Carnobacteriaceae bacterium zg-ZUI78]|nr:site-specific integrase [Carnobacteriaceae bacterium zg-ZUI78]
MKKQPTKYPNIFEYTTKKGVTKYRVIITVNGTPVDKSGFAKISDAKSFILNIQSYVEEINTPKVKEYTFDEYYQIYKENKLVTGQWNKTTEYNKSKYYKYVQSIFGNKKLQNITKVEFQNFINSLILQGYRRSTIVAIKAFIVSVLNDAINNEILSLNRMRNVVVPKTEKPPINKYLKKEDYETVYNYVMKTQSIQIQTMFLLLSYGLRKGEALAIREEAITYMPDGTVKLLINKSITDKYPNGKSTKTNQDRIVFGDVFLADKLKECTKSSRQIYASDNKLLLANMSIIVSPNCDNYHAGSISNLFCRISKKTGIQISAHMLRHYFATQAQLTGLNPRLIADVLGHANIKMTEHYSHATEEGARKVMLNMSDKIKIVK